MPPSKSSKGSKGAKRPPKKPRPQLLTPSKSIPPTQSQPRSTTTTTSNPPSHPALPINWPPDLPFFTSPIYSSLLTPHLSSPSAGPPAPPLPTPHVRITRITSPATHPALHQHGLFAAADLPPDSLILEYVGHYHARAESDPASDYDLAVDREALAGVGVFVDAAAGGNEARFVNDYRGVRERPNAEFRDLVVGGDGDARVGDGGGASEGEVGWERKRIGVFVKAVGKRTGYGRRGIRKGEEILVSYGKGFWTQRLGGVEDPMEDGGDALGNDNDERRTELAGMETEKLDAA